jgi:predicted PurR-regulated permease PerM
MEGTATNGSNGSKADERRELRKFALTVGTVFGILGGLFLWRGKAPYPYFLVIAAALILAGLIRPRALRPVHRVWMGLARAMSWVMTRVILVILFFAVVTPIGLVARMLGKDFLNLKFDNNAGTYWIYREAEEEDPERYEKQY